MLKKLLSKLKPPQNQKQGPEEPQSPNLLLYSDVDTAVKKFLPGVVVLNTYLSLAVGVATVALLTWNNSLDRQLEAGLKERNLLTEEVGKLSNVESDLKEIVTLTNVHKRIKNEMYALYPYIDYLVKQVPASIEILAVEYNDGLFEFSVESGSPLDIARFIVRVLEDERFKSVVIESVSLNMSRGKYESVLEVDIK